MWIKICGITTVDDAGMVVAAGADAIGLNFYPSSARYVSLQTAQAITGQCGSSVDLVGVFVNASPEQVCRVCGEVGLTAVQFHGDESAEDIQRFQILCPDIAVIRAFRIGPATDDFQAQHAAYRHFTPPLSAALVDAWSADEYGGTGKTVAIRLLEGHETVISRLILAGGLVPSNVAEAASAVCPWGVDTASGVEVSAGVKSPELVRDFVSACRQAFPDDPLARITSAGRS